MGKGRFLAAIAVLLVLALLLGCAPAATTTPTSAGTSAPGTPTSATGGAAATPTSGTSGGITTGTATP